MRKSKCNEISHLKVEETDGFQAVDGVETDENPDIEKYYDVEQEECNVTQQ